MNSTRSKNRSQRNDNQWKTLKWLALAGITMLCITSGGCSAQRKIVYVNSSLEFKVIRAGEVAPFDGILITHGRYEQLLDYEGMAQ